MAIRVKSLVNKFIHMAIWLEVFLLVFIGFVESQLQSSTSSPFVLSLRLVFILNSNLMS